MLRRFWFECAFRAEEKAPPGTKMGCGVTAFDRDDAERLLRERVFESGYLPPFHRVIEDVDISSLDPDHVRPNMASPLIRGIWFPLGYER